MPRNRALSPIRQYHVISHQNFACTQSDRMVLLTDREREGLADGGRYMKIRWQLKERDRETYV